MTNYLFIEKYATHIIIILDVSGAFNLKSVVYTEITCDIHSIRMNNSSVTIFQFTSLLLTGLII